MSRPEIDADLAAIDAALRGEDDGSELALLVADVRASAPRMTPQLERRLAAIGTAPPTRSRRWQPVLAGALVAALAAVAVVVATRDHAKEATQSSRATPTNVLDSASSAVGSVPRRVAHDAALTLAATPRDFPDVADAVVRTTDRFGGIVQSSNVDQQGANGNADFDLRVPVARLEDALAALSRLADVRERSAGTEDVTAVYDAAARRLADARAERRALLRALAQAPAGAQAARLRARIAAAGRRIAASQRAVDVLRRRSDLARVDVTLVTERRGAVVPPHQGGWRPWHDALRVLEVTAGVLLVALAVLAPLALLAAFGLAAGRLARRRRREAALG